METTFQSFIIAPARNLRLPQGSAPAPTRALFVKEAARLARHLCAYSPWQLESLLDVPPERAFALHGAYSHFDTKAPGTPAVLSYYGAAYRNMAPQTFTAGQLSFAQKQLRILSAFYGLLRPLDGILPHRLGLKRDFSPEGGDLYAFWGDRLYKELYREGGPVLNLASQEYAKLITPHMREGDAMLSCRFLVQKPGGISATVSSVRAARGLMARFIVENKITRVEDLKAFGAGGYRFAPALCGAGQLVFVRRYIA